MRVKIFESRSKDDLEDDINFFFRMSKSRQYNRYKIFWKWQSFQL